MRLFGSVRCTISMVRRALAQVDEARPNPIPSRFRELAFNGLDAEKGSRLWLCHESMARDCS